MYVIIVVFCLASANALFFCFDAVLDIIGCGTVRYELFPLSALWFSRFKGCSKCIYAFCRFSVRNWNFSGRSIILAAVCITIAVIWGVYRNEDR